MSPETPQLTVALTASDPAARSQAAEALSHLGAAAREAAVPLVRASGDESEEVREWVIAALEQLGPPPLSDLDELHSLLDDGNADVGYWAATLIGRLGSAAAPAVSSLVSAASESHVMPVRERAIWALGKIGPPAAAALDCLKSAAESSQPRLARLAERAIRQIGS